MLLKSKLKLNQQGLTLMETTIGLGILMIGILSSLLLMMSSFKYSRQSEYEIVVVNLAREGIEIVRAMRNNETDDDENDFDIFALTEDSYYAFDALTTNSLTDVNAHKVTGATSAKDCNECRLYYKDGRYVHDSSDSSPTIFWRLIKIKNTNPSRAHEKKIISEVSWKVKNINYTYTLEAHLTDWQ